MYKPRTPDVPLMQGTPQKEHQWLERIVGDRTYAGSARMNPDEPPMEFTCTESF